jgi:hypothetical protein
MNSPEFPTYFGQGRIRRADYFTPIFLDESATNALKVGEDVLVPVGQAPLKARERKPQFHLVFAALQ